MGWRDWHVQVFRQSRKEVEAYCDKRRRRVVGFARRLTLTLALVRPALKRKPERQEL